MLLARLSDLRLAFCMISFMLCMQKSEMLLSARLSLSTFLFAIRPLRVDSELIPSLIPYRFKMPCWIFTFLLTNSSLKIFAFSTKLKLRFKFKLTCCALSAVMASRIEQIGLQLVLKDFCDIIAD